MTAALPRLILIRHGETAWSRVGGKHTGSTDLALTQQGEESARQLLPHFADIAFTRVLTSPMQRAHQTCALAGLGAQAQVSFDLSEWDYGEYEGRSTADIHRDAPGWNLYRDGCPGGESPAQVSDRADLLIADMLVLKGNIALFSHGQFCCALAARWIGLAVIEGQHLALDPASVSVLGPKPGHPGVPVITRWNTRVSQQGGELTDKANHAWS